MYVMSSLGISMSRFLPIVIGILGFIAPLSAKLEEPLVKKPFIAASGDNELQFSTRIRVEGFFGKNIEFLNNNNETDQSVIPARHTLDLTLLYGYGREKYGYNIVTIKSVARSKYTWGVESILNSDRMTVKLDANVFGDHSHTLNRQVLWFRELWIESTINEMFGFSLANTHTFTAGLFPFELGRGIALGAAYATDPDVLGFYSPNAVDQYAPGFKLSGSFDNHNRVRYDLYAEIMTNRSDTFKNVNLEIRGQQYGRLCKPWRGFGKINWLAAGRLQIDAYKTATHCVRLEPYGLFLDQREQQVEFVGDADSKLGTIGFAVEALLGDLEWGIDCAANVGRQQVLGWDRNTISMKADGPNGYVMEYNTEVVQQAGGSAAPYTKDNQKYINQSIRSQAQNGQAIGGGLQNSATRFRDPYTNKFSGYMAVADIMWACAKNFKLALTAGMASGDEAPNKDLDNINDSSVDGNYRGFISLQEQYAGKRVNSAFLLSGSGRIPRVLSFPNPDNLDNTYPDRIAQFNNLLFVGTGMFAKVSSWNLNSNCICYWQEHATRVFDQVSGQSIARYASPWLGIEFNLFADICLDNSMKLFGVTSVFIPGTHYNDIQGRPLNKDQQKLLSATNDTGASVKQVPTLGSDPGFTLNIGMEYRF